MNYLATGSETQKRRTKLSKTLDAAIKDAEEQLRDDRLTLPEILKIVSRANKKSFQKHEMTTSLVTKMRMKTQLNPEMIILNAPRMMKKIMTSAPDANEITFVSLFNPVGICFVFIA